MNISRIARHLLGGPWQVRLHFPRAAMRRIQDVIRESERSHGGELRFVVEATLPLADALRGVSARERAIELFSTQRIWDTEYNSGTLIYLLLADRDVEIVADRGIHARVGEIGWEAICREMEARFGHGDFERGVIEGISAISALLKLHFAAHQTNNMNELSDAPLVL